MSQPEWNVIDADAGILTLDYQFAPGARSTTFAARMADGKLLIVSPAKRFTDEQARQLAEFGEVGALMSNNGYHHLGLPEWAERYPNVRTFAPAEAIGRIKKHNARVGELRPLSELADRLGDALGIREVPNTRCGESWVWARGAGGNVWYTSDVLANMPSLPKLLPIRFLFWVTKSAPGYRPFNLALRFIVRDPKAALRLMREDLAAHAPTVVVPAHGDILDAEDVAEQTERILAEAG